MELTYHMEMLDGVQVMIPDITAPERKAPELNMFGRARDEYLMNKHGIVYTDLKTTHKLDEHLGTIQEQAFEMWEALIERMAKQEGVTAELKKSDQMEWIGRMGNIRQRAKEIVMSELIMTL